jgi:Cu-Zn family superoxide dismutase
MNHRPRRALLAAAVLLPLAACSGEGGLRAAGGAARSIDLVDAAGASVGSLSVRDGAGGVAIIVSARGMTPGTHGIHLHEAGRCEGPKFASAGGHWNPGMRKHGSDNPEGAHLGDLANLEVAANGTATASFTVAGATVARGAAMFADADGTALVIHAKADDYRTDPSGNSGDRIACAVLAAPR